MHCVCLVCQVEEFVALTDPRLSLFSGEEEQFDSYNDRPQHKITNFRYSASYNTIIKYNTIIQDEEVSLRRPSG